MGDAVPDGAGGLAGGVRGGERFGVEHAAAGDPGVACADGRGDEVGELAALLCGRREGGVSVRRGGEGRVEGADLDFEAVPCAKQG